MAIVPEISSGDSHTANHINQPFHVRSAVYDSSNDEIDITVGEGRVDWGNDSVTEFTSAQTTSVASPSTGTTYYVYIQSDGTLRTTTSSTYDGTADDSVRLGSVTTGSTVDDLTRDDLRGILPHTAPLSRHGDTALGSVKWTSGQPEAERTDGNGDTWLVRIDFPSDDSPRLNVRKNDSLHASFQWDNTNSRWELSKALSLASNGIVNVADPTNAQDATTKSWVETNAGLRETGSYTGDGTNNRTISTSFTPKQVTISSEESLSTGDGAVGWLTNQTHNWVLEVGGGPNGTSNFVIVSGGFEVTGSTFMNKDTVSYSYVALG